MKKFTIKRHYDTLGTPGSLSFDDGGFNCYTIERPHERFGGDHPCIPEGTYRALRFDSPKHGPRIWQLEEVPNRSNIQFHIANWPHELLGCIAPGESPATGANGEPGVSKSGIAFHKFMGLTAEDEEIIFTFTS